MRIDRVKLIAEMARQDMNGKELAEKADLSSITITAIKGGKSCSDVTGEKIAKALNVPIEKLI